MQRLQIGCQHSSCPVCVPRVRLVHFTPTAEDHFFGRGVPAMLLRLLIAVLCCEFGYQEGAGVRSSFHRAGRCSRS